MLVDITRHPLLSPLNASDIWVLKAITRGLTIRAGVSKFPRNDDEEKQVLGHSGLLERYKMEYFDLIKTFSLR